MLYNFLLNTANFRSVPHHFQSFLQFGRDCSNRNAFKSEVITFEVIKIEIFKSESVWNTIFNKLIAESQIICISNPQYSYNELLVTKKHISFV